MGKNKPHKPEGVAPTTSPRGSSSTLLVVASVGSAFAIGFGVALQALRLCDGAAAPSSLLHSACGVIGSRKSSAGAPTPAAHATPPPSAPPSIVTVGAGGVGAPPGQDPWAYTTHPEMASAGWNWTQLGMSRTSNFPKGDIKHYTAEEVTARGAMWVWHTTFARSIPAKVKGLAAEHAARIRDWPLSEYRKQWGSNRVTVAISDHPNFNRGVPDPDYGRFVRHPDRLARTMSEYLDMVEVDHPDEHIAVQQSPSRDFSEFGLPDLPPQLEELTKYTLNARNFWAATPPKVSVLHYDWQDSVLLQLSGTKKFTIVDPARLHTAYPCVAYLQQLKRVAPGVFETIVTDRELDNFPLVNITHPDLARHPLFKEAEIFTVHLEPGDALLLPAYWYHQVDSYAPPDRLNVAVNYWFQGHSLATRLYRTLRENLFIVRTLSHASRTIAPSTSIICAHRLRAHAVEMKCSRAQNCTENKPTPGVPHPCR